MKISLYLLLLFFSSTRFVLGARSRSFDFFPRIIPLLMCIFYRNNYYNRRGAAEARALLRARAPAFRGCRTRADIRARYSTTRVRVYRSGRLIRAIGARPR